MQIFLNFPAKRLSIYRKKNFVTPFNYLNDFHLTNYKVIEIVVQYKNKEYNKPERTFIFVDL